MIKDVQLVRNMAIAIKAHPKLYCQSEWGFDDLQPHNECGTPCCVRGWGMFISGLEQRYGSDRNIFYDKLGIFNSGAEIFNPNWPTEWLKRAEMSLENVDRYSIGRFIPDAEQAAAILQAMADSGEIWGDKDRA